MSEVWAAAAAAVAGAATSSLLAPKAKGASAVQYQNVDPTQVQQNAIAGDIATMSDATKLATGIGTSTAQQAVATRDITQPGYSTLAGNLTKDATALAKDPYAIPASVVDQLTQYAAENNITEGTGSGSGFSGNNMLRSLGINALDYGQRNLQSAMSALSILSGTAPNISPVSPLNFLLTPGQALQTQTNNNTNNQAINQGAANAQNAAANANSANLWDNVSSQFGGVVKTAVSQALTQQSTPTPTPTPTPTGGGSPY